jgi:hypothetical protein
MAFEERIDVHAELHDVQNCLKKTLKIKVSKREAWKYTIVS